LSLELRLQSTSELEREVHVGGVILLLKRLAAGAAPESFHADVSLPETGRIAFAPRGQGTFAFRVILPDDFPSGDFEGSLAFEQTSAVKFYPPEASFTFHVPSFWERYGLALSGGAATLGLGVVGVLLHRRRPIPVTMVVEGDETPARPVPFRIHGHASVGGGATDRFRIVGLPQKIAVFERRSVDSFALVSSQPEIVSTVLEYTLGDAVEVRSADGGRKVVRFVRSGRKASPVKPRVVPSAPRPSSEGGVDFR
jgi:hypothetical protein